MASNKVFSKYKKHTDHEHVLKRPGMYIGSVETVTEPSWVIEGDKVVLAEEHTYNPGILKLFDEISTNASDHAREYPPGKGPSGGGVSQIFIEVSDEFISVANDGPGIPIDKHPEYNVYIPELIFAHFRTSTNYDDSVKRIKGGMNGLGAKITATFSRKFVVETIQGDKRYRQIFEKNLSEIHPPEISPREEGEVESTRITFYPDFDKFGEKGLTEGTVAMLKKRAYDLKACLDNPGVSVHFNGDPVPFDTFEEYVDKFFLPEDSPKVVIKRDRWTAVFAPNPHDKFTQVSFVNGLSTPKGGTHVDHVVSPVIKTVTKKLKSKHKDASIRPSYVKENVMVFVNSLIENPNFKSQSKEELTTSEKNFGSELKFKTKELESISKLGYDLGVMEVLKAKETRALASSDGRKKSKIKGIPKLEDAHHAGGKKAHECTLIVTEGDSAKTFAVAGLSKVGKMRDFYGIFPLRGKLLNVRKATPKQLSGNSEIKALKTILGLRNNDTRNHDSPEDLRRSLRYGKVLLLTDEDLDGHHIKGLFLNFIEHFWPGLLETEFIMRLQTPIVKCRKGSRVLSFFSLSEYSQWKESTRDYRSWRVKYYKGLGTSTSEEAREAFSGLETSKFPMTRTCEGDSESVDLAFNPDRSYDRKKWIKKHTGKELHLDTPPPGGNTPGGNTRPPLPVKEFFDKEFVAFSISSNVRSIPNLMDGLKPSQRKVIYTCLKNDIKNETKVIQLAGDVMKHSSYHHGDASLNSTIVALNHDFVGSNNLNLLNPVGQFGTRIIGGKDSASPRYISTCLNPITRKVFRKEDDDLLTYLDDDGYSIEPEYYYPIIPMVLVNGANGIGTGYSTFVPCYSVEQLVNQIKRKMEGKPLEEMRPSYRGFKGEIVPHGKSEMGNRKWLVKGKVERIKRNSVRITELPIGEWTENYKEKLESLTEKGVIEDFKNCSCESEIDFRVKMCALKLDSLTPSKLLTTLGLTSKISTTNMHLFNPQGKLRVYDTPEEIIEEFYPERLKMYEKRYNFILGSMRSRRGRVRSRIHFVEKIMEGTIKVFRVPREEIISQLELYPQEITPDPNFDYLLSMRIHSFSKEKLYALREELKTVETEIDAILKQTPKSLWLADLDDLLLEMN